MEKKSLDIPISTNLPTLNKLRNIEFILSKYVMRELF